MPRDQSRSNATVAIVGGGLAGLAAAVAAERAGLRVELFEQTKHLGGRAGSFLDPQTGQLVDFCPHVAMGCCTALADLCRTTCTADCFQHDRTLHFFGPDGKQYEFAASRWLPAPLHLLPGLLRLGYLTRGDRWAIARALFRLCFYSTRFSGLAEEPPKGGTTKRPKGGTTKRPEGGTTERAETIGTWLHRQGQSEQAIERFWSVVLVSALGETVDRASLVAARKVFRDGFLASRRAYELVVPRVPLGEIWDRVGQWLVERGATIHFGAGVRQIAGDGRRVTGVVLRDGTHRSFDFVVAAVTWRQIGGLLAPALFAAMPALRRLDEIASAPITAVHLWFDRPITTLPHAALVGRLSQWVFTGSARCVSRTLHHYQVVISASRGLVERDKEIILAEVRGDLEAVWPAAREAQLLHWRIITHPAAVFSVLPGLDAIRPPQQTPVKNLLLAGDWTATGWPATMEGAVRSGYAAVDAILKTIPAGSAVTAPRADRGGTRLSPREE